MENFNSHADIPKQSDINSIIHIKNEPITVDDMDITDNSMDIKLEFEEDFQTGDSSTNDAVNHEFLDATDYADKTCETCKNVFLSKHGLHEHIESGCLNSQASLIDRTCVFCNRIASSAKGLGSHMKSHAANDSGVKSEQNSTLCVQNNDDILPCKCMRKFSSLRRFQYHVQRNKECNFEDFNREKFRTCVICSKLYTDRNFLVHHIKKFHPNSYPFVCKSCGLALRSRYEIHLHFKMTKKCENSEEIIVLPETKEIVDNSKDTACKNCKSVFISTQALQEHFQSGCASSFDLLDRTCVLCNKIAITSKFLRRHMKNAHNNAKPFACQTCNKKYPTRSTYRHHFYKNSTCVNMGESGLYNDCSGAEVSCEKCNKNFENDASLMNHMATYHKKTYPCKCKREFENIETFHRHIQHRPECHFEDFKKEKFRICTICNKLCISVLNLKRHMDLKHPNLYPFACKSCGLKFVLRRDLLLHFKLVKCKNSEENSELLGETESPGLFTEIKNLKAKEKGHKKINIKYRRCHICGKEFSSIKNLRIHIVQYHDAEKSFECTICGRKFVLRVLFLKHLARKKKCKGIEYAKCPICKKELSGGRFLKDHMNRNHQDIKPFNCCVCNESFILFEDFENHVFQTSTCSNEEQKTYIEEYKSIIRVKEENPKIKIISKNRTYPKKKKKKIVDANLRICVQCNKLFDSIVELEQHMNDSHEGLRPFSCKNCKTAFVTRRDIQKHFRFSEECTNSEEVIFLPKSELTNPLDLNDVEYLTCNICHKIFDEYKLLGRHMNTAHKGERQFFCSKCDLKFVTKRALHIHLRKLKPCRKPHQDIESRTCPLCKMTFRSSNAVRSHWRRSHKGLLLYSCKVCSQSFQYKKDLLEHTEKSNCSGIQIKEEPTFESYEITEFGNDEDFAEQDPLGDGNMDLAE